jgi:hypothetical protein
MSFSIKSISQPGEPRASGAIVVSTPFAMSELLTPEMWTAISVLLKEAR